MLTVKHLGLIMAAQGFGSMIFVSDYAALVGFDRQNYINTPEKFEQDFSLNYGFVKGSYVNYVRQAAGYLGEHNARCNCIAYAPLAENVPEGFSKAFIRHSHLKRLATARDIKAAVVFLASDASAYITGITLPVDGGYTAK
jgi:NAD(P)-dependent dehydrogenase (short-subunit alcohol dehydrogenase family)